jgi:hypothetical protein
MNEEIIGKYVTREDLRDRGWIQVGCSTHYLIFEKGEKRIFWNPEANCIEREQDCKKEKPDNKKDVVDQETKRKNIPRWVV